MLISADTVSLRSRSKVCETHTNIAITSIPTDVTNEALRRTMTIKLLAIGRHVPAITHSRAHLEFLIHLPISRSRSLKSKMNNPEPANFTSTRIQWSHWHSRNNRHRWKRVLQGSRREASRLSCLAIVVSVRPVCLCDSRKITSMAAVVPLSNRLSRWTLAGKSLESCLRRHKLHFWSVSKSVTKILRMIKLKIMWQTCRSSGSLDRPLQRMHLQQILRDQEDNQESPWMVAVKKLMT